MSEEQKTAHTPGPWVVAVGEDGYTEVRTLDDGSGPYFIATVHGGIRGTADNARLIAAAPDLLAAVHELRGWMPPSGDDRIDAALAKADAAIAKAEGRS